MSMRPIAGSGVSGMADWIHIGGKSTTLTPGERRILDKLRSGQTEAQIRHDLQIAIGELVDAIASIKSKGYSTEQVHERRTRKMTEEKSQEQRSCGHRAAPCPTLAGSWEYPLSPLKMCWTRQRRSRKSRLLPP